MKIIKNMSVLVKILVPIIILAVMQFATVVVNTISMNDIMDASKEVSDNYATSMSQLGDIATNFTDMEKIAYAHCIADGDDAMRKLESAAETLSDDIDATCAEFELSLDAGEEAEAYQKFRTLYAEFSQTFETILKLSGNDQDEEAVVLINTQLANQADEISNMISSMRSANKDGMTKAALETQNAYQSARNSNNVMLVYWHDDN